MLCIAPSEPEIKARLQALKRYKGASTYIPIRRICIKIVDSRSNL